MDFSVWLTKINPNDLPATVVLLIVLVGVYRIFSTKLWPFLTEVYFPARVKQDEARLQIEAKQDADQLALMNRQLEALLEMRTANLALNATMEQWTAEQRANFTRLFTQQQAMLGALKIPSIEGEKK